jgi:hypothetical protein
VAIIDTGFTGFLSMPLLQALPLSLVLAATVTVTLADGSTAPKLLVGAKVTLPSGQTTSGLVVLEENPACDVLMGMEFLGGQGARRQASDYARAGYREPSGGFGFDPPRGGYATVACLAAVQLVPLPSHLRATFGPLLQHKGSLHLERQQHRPLGSSHGTWLDVTWREWRRVGRAPSDGIHIRPALILLCAGMTSLSAGRIDEAASHAREALASAAGWGRGEARPTPSASLVTSRRPAAPRSLKVTTARRCHSPVSSACARSSPTATSASAKLYQSTGKREQATKHLSTAATIYREMDMWFWLEQAEAEMRELA